MYRLINLHNNKILLEDTSSKVFKALFAELRFAVLIGGDKHLTIMYLDGDWKTFKEYKLEIK